MKTRMDRLGHTEDRVNMIYSHPGDDAQKEASKVIWQTLEAAESKRKQRSAVP